jgi:hypothetical protein
MLDTLLKSFEVFFSEHSMATFTRIEVRVGVLDTQNMTVFSTSSHGRSVVEGGIQ